MAVDLTALRARVETDLDDATLQTIIDASVESVDRSAGNASSATETFQAKGAQQVVLRRRAASITSVDERVGLYDEAATTLAADDYRLIGAYSLLRLGSGTNPGSRWGAEVVVVYQPEVDANLRDRVALDLCAMAIEFRGVEEEESGDYKQTQKEYKSRRLALLREVREGASPLS